MASYKEVMATIAASSKEDWLTSANERHWTYKGDLNIRLEQHTDSGTFSEPWALRFAGDAPKPFIFTIYYGTSFVKDVHMVAVDGGRAYRPYPKSSTDLVITDWEYKFAQIVKPPFESLDRYLAQAGIRVA